MSLVMVIKTTEGLVVAADGRTVYQNYDYKDDANKIFQVNSHALITMTGDIDYLLPAVNEFLEQDNLKIKGVTEIARGLAQHIIQTVNKWKDYLLTPESPFLKIIGGQSNPNFIMMVAGVDQDNNGKWSKQKLYSYSLGNGGGPIEILGQYLALGVPEITNYMLKIEYTNNLEKMVRLALKALIGTAKTNVAVGGKFRILTISKGKIEEIDTDKLATTLDSST